MQVLQVEHNIAWLPQPNELSLVLSQEMPPLPLITSALALAFVDDQILMTNLSQRGWDIPGGHIEPGETPEEAMRREVFEESSATLQAVEVLGWQHIRLLGAVPIGYRYPHPESYQVLFWGKVAHMPDFQSTEEASERALFAPTEARRLHWVQENLPMYEAALQIAQQHLYQ